MRQAGTTGPYFCGWSTAPLKYFEQLVNVRPSGEEGHAGGHFGKDTSDGPDVYCGGVSVSAKQELGRSVPEGNDLVGVGPIGESGEPGETEIS